VDFDKKSWMADAAAFASTCQRFQVPVSVERSRSGNGAHIWLFFNSAVLAANARQLGCALLTRTMENRHEIGLGSYDRLFPSQDTLPKGGFGNLLALPLQKRAREQGNSVFLDELFQPHPGQWKFLESVQRVPTDMLARMIQEIAVLRKNLIRLYIFHKHMLLHGFLFFRFSTLMDDTPSQFRR
jgi:hypothetical protein